MDGAKANQLVWFILANLLKSCRNMNEKQLRAELDAVYGSLSWRITAPLRYLSAFVKRSILPFLSPKFWLKGLIAFILRRPTLVSILKRCLMYVPGAKVWAKGVMQNAILESQSDYLPAELDVDTDSQLPVISANSLLIYRELQAATQEQN